MKYICRLADEAYLPGWLMKPTRRCGSHYDPHLEIDGIAPTVVLGIAPGLAM